MSRAVVFAYHNVGYRCLAVLLAQGVDVALVVTHEDDPNENVWFGSVSALAHEHGIATITPDDPNATDVIQQVEACQPDFIFSFYYRKMLGAALLGIPGRGAYNMHGSLLPKYRGRVPVNWAIIHGESECGATLHEMLIKPDAGRIVDQMAVPILPDDTAREVFDKVLVAAELTLHRCLPALLAGTAQLTEQNLAAGSYFSGRKAEDGRIAWQQTARQIHNLIRAVTAPYPGAFCEVQGHRLTIWRSQCLPDRDATATPLTLYAQNNLIFACCSDGERLQLRQFDIDGNPADAASFLACFGPGPVSL